MRCLKQENSGLGTPIDEGNKTSFVKLVPMSVLCRRETVKQRDERKEKRPRRNEEFQAAICMSSTSLHVKAGQASILDRQNSSTLSPCRRNQYQIKAKDE